MKKTLVSALTTALVVGAASTTFAAANPFSDVPADHWAYDAVQQLAQDGVVEGYGDGTFRGQQNITRYEMAQMIAKAMAKADTSAADKALIDKLAAEFSDELKNLGVRVANLENKVDNVKWDGFVRYDYNQVHKKAYDRDDNHVDAKKPTAQRIILRLNTSMQINDNWTGHARIEHYMSANSGMSNSVGVNQSGLQENFTRVNKAYAEGKYGQTTIKLGRFGTFDNASHGLQMDDNVTGAEVSFPVGKNFKMQLTAGRSSWGADDIFNTDDGVSQLKGNPDYGAQTSTYLAGEVTYTQGKFDAGVGVSVRKGQRFASQFAGFNEDGTQKELSKIGAWSVGLGYRFDKNAYLTFDYAHAMGFDTGKLANYYDYANDKDHHHAGNHSYNIQFNYKGADVSKRGSYGLFLAYRKIANAVSPAVTYDDGIYASQKGWAVGGTYVFTKNVTGYVDYFWGKNFNSQQKQNRVVGQLTFLF